MFCCTLRYVHSSIAIILMGKRELVALLNLSSWCFAMVERLFLAVPRGCLQFVIVVFTDHTYLLFSVLASARRMLISVINNWARTGHKPLDTLILFLKQTYEKDNKKESADGKRHAQFPSKERVTCKGE